MIPLESPYWAALPHCYGSAANIPALLKAAGSAPRQQSFQDEPWYTLWSSLCHQDDVFPASYAAVPHLIEIARHRDPAERDEPLLLAASIEISRASGRGPTVPASLAPGYQAALKAGAQAVAESLASELPERRLQVLLACSAVFAGHSSLGSAILELSPQLECPSCGETFFGPGFDRLGKGA